MQTVQKESRMWVELPESCQQGQGRTIDPALQAVTLELVHLGLSSGSHLQMESLSFADPAQHCKAHHL